MRLLHLAPFFRPDVGGMETFSSALVTGLGQRGHQSVVVASQKDGSLPERYEWQEVPVHRVDFYRALLASDVQRLLHTRRKVVEIKKQFRPDATVVHVGGPVPMAFLELSTVGVAPAHLLVVAHDLPAAGTASPTLAQLFERASAVVAVSNARLEDAKLIAPAAAPKMQVIYPCLPWRALNEGVQPSAQPLVVMAGRLDPAKGFGLAVQAFVRVHREMPEARLVLVGGGPILSELQEQVHRLGLDDVVRLAGHASDADLTRFYQQAWVSLVPSRHSESFGLVALEAMQAGCPVIASRTGGLSEVVVDGETGFLVEVDDVAALSNRMLTLLRDRQLGARMGQAGLERARSHFDWETCLSAYEALLVRAAHS